MRALLVAALFLLVGCPAEQANNTSLSLWQELESPDSSLQAWRLEAPHGWVVYVSGCREGGAVYVPDEGHEWPRVEEVIK